MWFLRENVESHGHTVSLKLDLSSVTTYYLRVDNDKGGLDTGKLASSNVEW